MLSNKKIYHFNIVLFPIFFILAFIGYFLFFKQFGLYEDDYEFVVLPMNASFSGMLSYAKHILLTFPLGRPLGTIVPYYISYFSYNFFGFNGLYIIGALIVTTNVLLLFNLIKRRFDFTIAFLGALSFLFFPADTTKGLLIHIFQLQISLMYSIIACHLYLEKKRILAFIIASLSLVSYESPYLIFLFVPFLSELNFSKQTFFIFCKHCLISVSIFILLFILRKLFEEPRVGNIQSTASLRNIFFSLITGPLTSFYSFIAVPIKSLLNITESYIIVVPVAVIVIGLLFLFRNNFNFSEEKPKFILKNNNKGFHLSIDIPENLKKPLMAVGIGVIMLIGSYLFAFTHYPPKTIIGRRTSVHLAASVASAFIFGGLGQIILYTFSFYTKKIQFILLGLYISLLAGNGFFIQKDFIASWSNQQHFWDQVLDLCPDINENTNILIERSQLEDTRYIYTHSWAIPMILENLYEFPKTWVAPPKVIVLDKSLDNEITERNDSLFIHPRYSFLFEGRTDVYLENDNTILLQSKDNELKRVFSKIEINRDSLQLKNLSKELKFKKKTLYSYLILNN